MTEPTSRLSSSPDRKTLVDSERRAACIQERERRRRLQRRLDIATLLANAVGAVLVIIFFVLTSFSTEPTDVELSPWFLYLQIFFLAIPFVVGDYLGKRLDAKLRAWYHKGQMPSAAGEVPQEVQRTALHYPAQTALITLFMWLTAGLLFGVMTSFYTGQFSWANFVATFLSVGGFAGSISATLVYFITERLWQREIPIFFPQGRVSEIPAFRMTVQRRILIIFVLGSIPILLLAFSGYYQAQRIAQAPEPLVELSYFLYIEAYLLLVSVLVTLTLALTIGVSMIRSVNVLRDQMQRVQQGDLDASVPVYSNDEFGELNEGFNAMVSGLQEEATIRSLFSRYVTPEVAEHAIAHGAELGGQEAVATVLFSDIRGFTTLTEQLPAAQLIALLNRYFNTMSEVIQEQGGVINKFGGDSLLAIFGTPLYPREDHAGAAVQAAQGMLQKLREFNESQRKLGEPTLRIGIGIATGPVVVGNVGSESRLEYTVIGDTVNLASRLEELTKAYAMDILIAATTVTQLEADTFPLKNLGEQSVRGKRQPVALYTLRELRQGASGSDVIRSA